MKEKRRLRWRARGAAWVIGGRRGNGGSIYRSEYAGIVRYHASPWRGGQMPPWVRDYGTLDTAKRAVESWLARHATKKASRP